MISSNIEDALNAQICAELSSAYLYLSMSLFAARQNMPGLSNWMFVQWQEEQDHARILQKYMLSRENAVELRPIEGVPTNWDSLMEMAEDALYHEQDVTAMINNLMSLATDECDYATMGRLRWFVDEQVEEEEQVRDLIRALDMVNGDSYGLYEIDQQLAHRRYKPADAL